MSTDVAIHASVTAAARATPMHVFLASSIAEATARAAWIAPTVILVSSCATEGDSSAAFKRLRMCSELRRALIVLAAPAADLAIVSTAHADEVFETPLRASELGSRLRGLSRLHGAAAQIDALRAEVTELSERAPIVPARDDRSGAYDRTYLALRLAGEIERARRYGRPLTIVRVALDDLPNIQRRVGRTDDDDVIRALAATLQQSVRTTDVVARLRGAEFVVLAPSTDESGGAVLATRLESIARALFKRRVPGPRGAGPVARVGVATLHGRDGNASPNARELLAASRPAREQRAAA